MILADAICKTHHVDMTSQSMVMQMTYLVSLSSLKDQFTQIIRVHLSSFVQHNGNAQGGSHHKSKLINDPQIREAFTFLYYSSTITEFSPIFNTLNLFSLAWCWLIPVPKRGMDLHSWRMIYPSCHFLSTLVSTEAVVTLSCWLKENIHSYLCTPVAVMTCTHFVVDVLVTKYVFSFTCDIPILHPVHTAPQITEDIRHQWAQH